MYRVELIEETDYYGVIERISCPCASESEIYNTIGRLKKDFEEFLTDGTHYIKVVYVNVKESEESL